MNFVPYKSSYRFNGEYTFDPGRSLKNDKSAWDAAKKAATPIHKIHASKRDIAPEELYQSRRARLRIDEIIKEMQVDVTIQG